MKHQILLLIFLIISFECLSQTMNDYEVEVLTRIVHKEVGPRTTKVNFQCKKYKTYFDSAELKQTGLQIPGVVLRQLSEAAKRSSDGEWDPQLLEALKVGPNFIKTQKCLSKEEVIQLFETTKKRHNIISISQPIFDDNFEHCDVSVAYWNYIGSASGYKCFLKKIYGKWIIVEVYGIWLT